MTWLSWGAIKLLLGGWLKRLTAALGGLLKWAGHNPWQALVIALCTFSGWLWWHDSRVIEDRDKAIHVAAEQIKGMEAASEQNRLAQIAAVKAKEQHYKDIAHEADKEHAEQLADANDALARYIATHRVRPESPGGGFSAPGGTAESGSAEVPAGLSADSFVAVSDDDMRRCTAIATYALDAHNWVLKLAEQK